MAIDLTGITNVNEYYTNHYLASIFEENAASTISNWKSKAKGSEEVRTPWSQLKENAKTYYTIHNRYLGSRFDMQRLNDIQLLADKYLKSLGYPEGNPQRITISNEVVAPVYLEVSKSNGAPWLWIMLAVSEDKDEGILEKKCFLTNISEQSQLSIDDDLLTTVSNEDLISKVFFSLTEPPRFIVLVGMNQIALIDRNKWNEKRYLQFELNDIFSRREDTTLQAMSVLLHYESLCPTDGQVLLDELDDNSQRHASGVSQDLKYALRESIELLGNEILYDLKNRQMVDLDCVPVDAGQLTIECLRYMYRMLFVLFIESRSDLGFIPIKEQSYFTGYSLESLRDIADSIREDIDSVGDGYYLHETLSKLYEMIYTGYPEKHEEYYRASRLESKHDMFVIPPLKAHIFDPDFTNEYVNHSKIRNSIMLKIVDLMSLTRVTGKKGSRRGRISYSNLGINQMGAVYEALLSYRGFIAKEDLYEVKAKTDKFNELDVGYFVSESELDQYDEDERVRLPDNSLRVHRKGEFVYRLAGREREKSASYYTPECLTKCLVKYALKELLTNKSADEILELTVCEPAMGSAAFLNETVNQLAEAYLNKKQQELAEYIPAEQRKTELQKVKMYIADNNVYGVDLNPVAVELAEVSLWLNTIYEGGYVPWFGAQLVNGNSLIGARRQTFTYEQLTTKAKNLRWYENAPKKIPFYQSNGKSYTAKVNMGIYHFLLGDPGMCNYADKVIKSLEQENIIKMIEWNKQFIQPYTFEELEQLKLLSSYVDVLWTKQIQARRALQKHTRTPMQVWRSENTNSSNDNITIKEKDKILQETYKSEKQMNAGAYARLKFAMDYWCSLWFWPIDKAEELPSRAEFLQDLEWILLGVRQTESAGKQMSWFGDDYSEDDSIENTKVNIEQLCDLFPRLALVRQISQHNKFMHWELEFAEIFADNGGFDMIVGNPPWIRLEWKEQDVLSDKNPAFAIKKLSATETTEKRNEALSDYSTREAYFSEYVLLTGQQNYLNSFSNYPELKGQQTNLYKCFLPIAWKYSSGRGVSAFIHPDGVFDDPKGKTLREIIYPKLRYHFQFTNELKLFPEVHHCTVYSLNIYNNEPSDFFEMISNLYAAETIDYCYESDGTQSIPGIKDDNGSWNVNGHSERIIKVGQNELELFSSLFDDGGNAYQSKLPIIHVNSFLNTLKCLYKHRKLKDYIDDFCMARIWDETGAQNDGTIYRCERFPESPRELIYSGSMFGLSNPVFKGARKKCLQNSDFDNVDLTNIDSDYLQRSKFSPKCSSEVFNSRIPTNQWGTKCTDDYRIVMRNMFSQGGERTLVSAIVPRGATHIHAVFGITSHNEKRLVLLAGIMSSLVMDFYVKVTGKSSGGIDVASNFVLPESKYTTRIMQLTLMLNCLNSYYSELWKNCFNLEFTNTMWAKTDKRLNNDCFSNLTDEWSWNTPLRTDYERRQALVELDVLVAMSLGLNLEQLKTIYRIQFPVLMQYESDTWYDSNGRIVFTNNRSLVGVGFERKMWEESIKNAECGESFSRIVVDDTNPCGQKERSINYVAPFDRCDREKDYEIAWKFFEEKYNK